MSKITPTYLRGLVLLGLCVAVLVACTPVGKPSVVIMSPPSGSQFFEGEDIAVQSTATDSAGVVRVELVVDGAVVRVDPSPTAQGQPNFALIQTWKATTGVHTILVRAYNATGAVSDPAGVSVNVLQRTVQAPTLTPTIPSAPPYTPTIPSASPRTPTIPSAPPPVITVTPSPTSPAPPPPPPPPPVCSGTPIIQSFTASAMTITAGNPTTLSWGAVTNAEYVEIDNGIGGVGAPGSQDVSPNATTTYTLIARCGATIATRQVTITVNPAPPPPPEVPVAPSGLTATGTGTTIQFTWTDNSTNEVGFRIYQVGVVAPPVTIGAHTGTGGMSYNWAGRPCNVSVTFLVKAYNTAGESNASNTNAAVTIPCTPTGFSAAGASQTTVNVSFTDNATNESGFRIYRTGSATSMVSLSLHSGTGSKSGTVGSIPCGTQYTYYARAYNSAGESASSNTNDGTTSGCTVTVTFTSVHVYDDEDPSGSGEIHFDFTVNGATRRWPSTGENTISSGETKTISGVSVPLTLLRTQNLSISVEGTDHDFPPFDPDDSLGTATATYTSASNWSEGARCTESASPHDFRICYTINVIP